jgi:hypothetical protein
MKAKIDTLVMNAWDAFVSFVNDIYGDNFLETATQEQLDWEWKQFSSNLELKK